MNVFKELLNNIIVFGTKYTFWLSLLFGLLFLLIGYDKIYFENENYFEVFKVAGTVILSSGIFLSIAKSIQFSGIFSDELRKIIFGEEHLEQRKDIFNLWRNTSRALYNKKFPEISDAIEKIITESYLPITKDYYFENSNYNIDIDIDPNNNEYIILTETMRTKIKTSVDDKVVYSFKSVIDIPSSENNKYTEFELIELTINNKKIVTSNILREERQTNKLINKLELEKKLIGFQEYDVLKKVRKRYSLNSNKTKGHTAVSLTKNFYLEVTYPNQLAVDFYKAGTVYPYTSEFKTIGEHTIMKQSYKGIIFPKQGFRLMFSKK